jgi:DNA-binding beta-propeller fold protein YncE
MRRGWWVVVLATLVAAAWVTVAAAAGNTTAAGGYKLVRTFGKVGTGPGQVSGPRGIVVASNGNVYVADANNGRIEVFSSSGAYKAQWGSVGSGNGQFTGPRDVDIAPDGTVWVADDGNARAQQFTATGAYKSSVAIGSESARGVAVDKDGNVLVAAEGGTLSGFHVFTGGAGEASPLLGAVPLAIQDVEASPDGTVFVSTAESNAGNPRVRHFTADGKPLGVFAIPNATNIAVDPDCNVWAGDFPGRAITKYSPSGKKLATAASPDLQANDIAVARNGDLFVTAQPGSIVHFAENRAAPAAAAIPARLTVAPGGVVKIPYTLRGVACPAQVAATASLTGPGISGKAAGLELAAGKTTVITIQLARGALKKAAASGKATFKVVLKTNGRPTTEAKSVTVSVPAGSK